MKRIGWITWIGAMALMLVATANALACAAPKELVGRWEVEYVKVDLADQMHWGLRPDEPALMGRSLIITPSEVHFTADDKSRCAQSRWRSLASTWSAVFRKGFSRAAAGGRSEHPSPEDFGLSVPAQGLTKAYLLCPSPKAKDVWMHGKWVAQQDTDTLLMHYDNQVVLVLRRRPQDDSPRASFPCEKATSAAEKAICADLELASWDRSVAEAMRQALAAHLENSDSLLKEQRAWRQALERCGANHACLDETLWRRVSEIVGR